METILGQPIGLSHQIEAACRRHHDRVATWQVDGASVSFASYFATILAFTERLQAAGVGPGSNVSIAFQDGIAGRMLVLALLRLGATALPDLRAHPGVQADLRLVRHPDPTQPGAELQITADWIRSPARLVPIVGGGRLVTVTSGTTGLPKLRLLDEVGLAQRLGRSSDLRGLSEGTVFIGYAPGVTPGLSIGLRAILSGVAQINQPAAPEDWLSSMVRHRALLACLPPGSFETLLDVAEAKGTAGLGLREIRVGGGSLSPALALRGETLFGCPVINTYGSNETGSIAHHRPALSKHASGIVGKAYPDLTLRFLDEAGHEADPETGGTLWVRMPRALWVRDYPSEELLCSSDGWQNTGDLARRLADGSLQVLGRVSDVLNIGGNKIAPIRVEALAAGFAGLDRIAVFRAPAANGMDRVGLAVVPGPDFDASGFLAHMSARLGPHFPLVLRVVDCLPQTAAGKIDRDALVAAERVHSPLPPSP